MMISPGKRKTANGNWRSFPKGSRMKKSKKPKLLFYYSTKTPKFQGFAHILGGLIYDTQLRFTHNSLLDDKQVKA